MPANCVLCKVFIFLPDARSESDEPVYHTVGLGAQLPSVFSTFAPFFVFIAERIVSVSARVLSSVTACLAHATPTLEARVAPSLPELLEVELRWSGRKLLP